MRTQIEDTFEENGSFEGKNPPFGHITEGKKLASISSSFDTIKLVPIARLTVFNESSLQE